MNGWDEDGFPADDDGTPLAEPVLHRLDLGDLVERPHPVPKIHGNTIYPRKLHVVGGEPGHGKSTLLAWWLLAAIALGRPVVLFDWEAGAEHTSDLLQSFGAERAAISKYLHYFPHADLHWTPAEIREVAAELRRIKPVICGLDSSIAVLSAMGGNENDPAAIRRMWTRLAPIAHRLGCAVIATDHSGKDAAESRYNRGSTDKLAAVDVSMKLAAVEQFSRHRDGRLHLTVTKDRPGWLHWDWEITVTRDPLELHWERAKPQPVQPRRSVPRGAEDALREVLTEEPVSAKRLVDRIVARGGSPLKPTTAAKALERLMDAGLADRIDPEPGQPVLWYEPREGDDPWPEDAQPLTGPSPDSTP